MQDPFGGMYRMNGRVRVEMTSERWRCPILLIFAALLTSRVAAGQVINVSICNLGGLSASVVRRAEVETQAVFHSPGIRIRWAACDQASPPPWFTIRLRGDRPPATAGATSLDAMGRAFLAGDGSGYMADAYIVAVQELSGRDGSDAGVLLGVVIAHELGHLLLGPGHTRDGVMRASWGDRELKALSQRWLTFNAAQRGRMQTLLSGVAVR
jgi:hypothetical protein